MQTLCPFEIPPLMVGAQHVKDCARIVRMERRIGFPDHGADLVRTFREKGLNGLDFVVLAEIPD